MKLNEYKNEVNKIRLSDDKIFIVFLYHYYHDEHSVLFYPSSISWKPEFPNEWNHLFVIFSPHIPLFISLNSILYPPPYTPIPTSYSISFFFLFILLFLLFIMISAYNMKKETSTLLFILFYFHHHVNLGKWTHFDDKKLTSISTNSILIITLIFTIIVLYFIYLDYFFWVNILNPITPELIVEIIFSIKFQFFLRLVWSAQLNLRNQWFNINLTFIFFIIIHSFSCSIYTPMAHGFTFSPSKHLNSIILQFLVTWR